MRRCDDCIDLLWSLFKGYPMFSYTVRCGFTNNDVAASWLNWLKEEHIQDVLNAGATGAEVFKMNNSTTYEIRYQFQNKASFEEYELNHAPGLREEGLAKFPLELGLEYSRTTGQSLIRVDN